MDSDRRVDQFMLRIATLLVPQMRYGAKEQSSVTLSIRSALSVVVLKLRDAQHEPPSGPATRPDQWPADAPPLRNNPSYLRICIMGHAVMTVIWNNAGWVGDIVPGEWIVDVVKWACDQDWSRCRTEGSERC